MNRNNGRKIAERLMLLQDYFIKNADKTHAVSMEDIRRFYLENGIEGENSELVNIKTVYRDLDALGAYYGLDIAYSEKHKGYILRNPPVEAYELRLIVDSVQASKFITQTEAKRLTEKIQQHFGNGRRQNLNRRAYVYDRIHSQNDSVVKQTDRIHEAIAADCKIGFRYFHLRPDRKKEYSNGGKQIIVSPFALYWNGGNLLLLERQEQGAAAGLRHSETVPFPVPPIALLHAPLPFVPLLASFLFEASKSCIA